MPDAVISKKGFPLWMSHLGEATGQVRSIINGFPANLRGASKADKIIFATFAGLTTAVVSGAALIAGPAAAGIQALGFMASGLSMLNQHQQLNHHKLAVQPVVSGAMSVQQVLLGGFGYAVMAGIAGARSAVFAMIPQEDKYSKLKTGIAVSFAVAGMAGITALSFMTGRFSNLIMVPSMLMGTIADRIPSSTDPKKDYSRYARALRCTANTLNATFNLVVSGSVAGVFNDGLAAANLRSAIRDYDVPVQTKDGKPLSRRESLGRYMRSMLNLEPANGLTPQQIKLAGTTPSPAPEPALAPATISVTYQAPEYRIAAPEVSKIFDAHRDAPTDIPAHIAARPDNLPKNNNI